MSDIVVYPENMFGWGVIEIKVRHYSDVAIIILLDFWFHRNIDKPSKLTVVAT